jgi:hypothetical protein
MVQERGVGWIYIGLLSSDVAVPAAWDDPNQ